MEGEGRAVTRDFKHSFKAPERAELPLVVYNAGFQKCPPGYGWGPGIRDHYLIHYIVSGRGTYETAGRTFVPEAGEAFLVRPEEPVYYQADEEEPWEYYWVGFSGPSAPLLLAQTAFSGGAPVVQAGQQLRQALLEVYKARGTDYPSAVRMAGYLQAALGLPESVALSVAVTALVSGLTIGGKALGKTVALNKSTSVVYWVGRVLHLFHR